MFIPYNGGQLTRSDFCLACEYNTGCEEELDALLIIAEPRLTAFEKTINEAVSAHFSGAQTTNVQELLQLRIHLLQKTSRK